MDATSGQRRAFRQLHGSGCFVIPNPWNLGTAKYLQHLGFKALATTSSSPGLRTRKAIAAVVAAVAPKPVNLLIGSVSDLTLKDIAELGIRRVSVGGALARSAWGRLHSYGADDRARGSLRRPPQATSSSPADFRVDRRTAALVA